jgi:hypothetical protein
MSECWTDDELINALVRFASFPDQYGVDVPMKGGAPLLGEELNSWVDQHRSYMSEDARVIEHAAIGLAFALKQAELERGFTWSTHHA